MAPTRTLLIFGLVMDPAVGFNEVATAMPNTFGA